MMKKYLLIGTIVSTLLISCSGSNTNTENTSNDSTTVITNPDSVILSFAFMGCNRVDWKDIDNWNATDSSSANLVVLERVMREVMEMPRQPDLFFFLGDIVLAEQDLTRLNYELDYWVKLYSDTAKTGPMSTSGMEVVAVPGNHEMLTYQEYPYNPKYPNDTLHDEWPLAGATEVWMKYMAPFMPEDRDYIAGPDSVNNQMTFSFVRKNVAFIMMNTDTYNAPSDIYPYGREGMIPYDWITTKTAEYRADESIDHIFIMGHKPAYTTSTLDTTLHFDTIHAGFMHSEELWGELMKDSVNAMLSAHAHTYSRNQPMEHGTYQVIAGNAGSKNPEFYGYTIINVLAGGELQLISKGFSNDGEYYYNPQSFANGNPTVTKDSTTLIWEENKTSFKASYRQ